MAVSLAAGLSSADLLNAGHQQIYWAVNKAAPRDVQ